ncbi:M24 family metallopeptidase [Halolamina salifodinae]|uniref:Xaa-Pro aminopeptidase n=1 Tax=Halolamina salifodinae TaxID=1202767 RepID=A0A8T4GVA5_9EURY|nr:M24 family metallopeptidase [Halolamina salifodinae]MBP1986836.1 Xaa-Pro aminopeptidase [Halolamina salifodinae]
MTVPQTLDTDYIRLADAVRSADADAYVHIGDGTDDLLRYLTRVDTEDNLAAFVLTADGATVCLRPRYRPEAERKFPGDSILETDAERGIVEAVSDIIETDGVVRIPHTTSVGIARDLESLTSVDVVSEPDTIWCEKSDAEQRIAAHMADGVQRGIARAETVLAEAVVAADEVRWEGDALTTERLRREVKKELVSLGLRDMGNVVIGAGESCAELHFTGDAPIRPDETVLIDLGPRGPFGYFGDISRTFVPGEIRDWEQEAFEVVREALDSAFDVLSAGAGVGADELYLSMAEVIESYGYETGLHESRDDAVGLYHGTGHGIGVRIHEKPFQSRDADAELRAGNVITIEPGLYDPDRGGVRLEDVIVVEEDGYQNLMEYPYGLTPVEREIGEAPDGY